MEENSLALQNSLFAALPPESRQRLASELKLVLLPRGKVLYTPELPVTHVYFPIDAIVALVYLVDTGASSEVCLIGNEGMVGIFCILSDENTSNEAQVVSSGYAFSLPKKKMQAEFNSQACSALLLRYIQSLFAQMSQTAVCNRHHTIDQQLCRLLLMSLDRLHCNNLILTHDLIAQMLGVRRGGVSEAAGRLQKLGVIDYHRGHINVLDRTRLERLSCECYSVVKEETNRLLPRPIVRINENIIPIRSIPGVEPKCLHCFRCSNCVYLKKMKKNINTIFLKSIRR